MGFFQRVFDSVSKGYKASSAQASPSVAELQAMRERIVTESNDTTVMRSSEKQVEQRRDLSEVDGMIARANKLSEQKDVPPTST